MTHESYVSQAPRLLGGFDRAISRVQQSLAARYGEPEAGALIRESRREYQHLIPRIPFIGDRSPLLVFLLPATRYLAIYRAMERRGMSVEEAGCLAYEIGEAEIRAIPTWARHLIGVFWFSPWFVGILRGRIAQSSQRDYPGGYLLAYVAGDGIGFDYGIDYLQCAAAKFLREQDAAELGPYVCAVDKAASELLGWGLCRTTTLAEGGPRCDFRFTKGGRTCVPLPRSLTA